MTAPMTCHTMEKLGLAPQLFDPADLEPPAAVDIRELRTHPWAELVDQYDRENGTNVRAELEAAGIPVIPYEGSRTQAFHRRHQVGEAGC